MFVTALFHMFVLLALILQHISACPEKQVYSISFFVNGSNRKFHFHLLYLEPRSKEWLLSHNASYATTALPNIVLRSKKTNYGVYLVYKVTLSLSLVYLQILTTTQMDMREMVRRTGSLRMAQKRCPSSMSRPPCPHSCVSGLTVKLYLLHRLRVYCLG